jgi:benzoyl-CoA reductase subunit C
MTGNNLAHAVEVYGSRDKRARELKAQGKKIIGYFCCYPPVELMTALDLVPYRIIGDIREPISRADGYIESNICSFVRNCFELSLKGRYEFLDGVIIPHSCDAVEKLCDIWRYYHKSTPTYFLNVPHIIHEGTNSFYRAELLRLRQSLEELAGKKLQTEDLVSAIRVHNENRALLRSLYRLRVPDPPLMSGSEAIKVAIAATALPVLECNEMLRGIISEVNDREEPLPSGIRVLLYGGQIDDAAFVDIIENCGANVVMDDLCTTARCFWHEVELNGDPIHNLCRHYLDNIMCPRTLRQGTNHVSELENRFGYLKSYAAEFKATCAIAYTMRLCDTFEFDAPDLEDYLTKQGLPFFNLEVEYKLSSMEQLRTRIEAFLESVAEKAVRS